MLKEAREKNLGLGRLVDSLNEPNDMTDMAGAAFLAWPIPARQGFQCKQGHSLDCIVFLAGKLLAWIAFPVLLLHLAPRLRTIPRGSGPRVRKGQMLLCFLVSLSLNLSV